MHYRNFGNSKDESGTARLFAQKAIRSIIEVQPKINSLSDLVMLLEVLGYTNKLSKKNGFESLIDLATYVYKIIDVYDYSNYDDDEDFIKQSLAEVPSTIRRVTEGLSMMFPWLGSLVVLMLTGVSLWMIFGLPLEYATALITGVFLGLVITEGILQSFGRLLGFYYIQTNVDEVKRILRRNYSMTGLILAGTMGLIYGIGLYANIPLELVTITAISTLTVALHRASYVIIYALKKIPDLLISYSAAIAALLLVYFYSTEFLPDMITRYIVALSSAFAVLTGFAIYNHFIIIKNTSISPVVTKTPNFYQPESLLSHTLKSRFHVQLWETMPYFLFGTLFFSMLFLDRWLSWIFNPVITSIPGATLFMEFNTIYHSGADPALFVLLPAILLQYVIMGPIYAHMVNFNIKHKISELEKLKKVLNGYYIKTIVAVLISSIFMAIIFNLFATEIMSLIGGSEMSLQIFRTASISNIFVSFFAANFMFMMFFNKIKIALIIAAISITILATTGIFLAQTGFENLTYAYLASAIFASVVSFIYIKTTLKNSVTLIFSKFI